MERPDEVPFGVPGRRIYEVAKRFVDVIAALLGLLVLSPVLTGIAVWVKATSQGTVFYRGIRTGRFGRPFRIMKFRTMVVGAEQGAGTTSRDDPRITRTGKFLRRCKLDELPQLFNVLMGDMSFVGPRPELPRYTTQYRGEELAILAVKPGITDYSSITFANLNDLISDEDPDRSFEENVLAEKNRLRVQYVKERGFWRDMGLIAKTIIVCTVKKGL